MKSEGSKRDTPASAVVGGLDGASKSDEGVPSVREGGSIGAEAPIRSTEAPSRARIVGVDVARCLALMGMIANHTYPNVWDNGAQSIPHMVTGGRAAFSFALIAGVSIALVSGGPRPVEGRARTAVRAGLVVRGLLIASIGLMLGYFDSGIEVVLATYGLLFIFAIPLLGLRARVLWIAAIAIAVLVPVVFHLTIGYFPGPNFDANPTFGSLFRDPAGTLVALCITGPYPVLVYMAVICAGMAAGRSQLWSASGPKRLLIGGLVLAAGAWAISSLLLHPLGGLDSLLRSARSEGLSPAQVVNLVNRDAGDWVYPTGSWWWLAVRAPHSHAPLDTLHVMGAALALLGGGLLVTRRAVLARLLRPFALAGSMTLTLYSAHIVFNATSLENGLEDSNHYGALVLMQWGAALVFAVLWRRRFTRGPLEAVVAAVAVNRVRRAVTEYEGPPLTARSATRWVSVRVRGLTRPAASANPGDSP
jgi:uncharacterized membrane protein